MSQLSASSSLEEAKRLISIAQKENIRGCPSCELVTLRGMPGGRDSVCANCGYKDPCCYD